MSKKGILLLTPEKSEPQQRADVPVKPSPAQKAADPDNPAQRTGEEQAEINRADDPPA
jgi:hypothetical protein